MSSDSESAIDLPELSPEDFLARIHRSLLVEDERRDDLVTRFRQRNPGRMIGWQHLAELFVRAKVLTHWQIRRLLRNRLDGFFIGCYKLLDHLGTGGMGTVYLAEHTKMRRKVALKLLPRQLTENREYLEAFYHESEALAGLDHPNIVRAYDVNSEGETHYLALEYVEGDNLEKLTRETLQPFEVIAQAISDAAAGLQHAHQHGIIHCDIKPANLIRAKSGRTKILDMGLALWRRRWKLPENAANRIAGTPDYMAPEQALNQATVDPRADLYSLGCTMYFLLTGEVPYPSQSLREVLIRHIQDSLPDPRRLRPDTPEPLVQICRRLMAKQPGDRYRDAREVRTSLEDWLKLHRRSVAVPKPAPGTQPTVLVADDDEVIRTLLRGSLETAGYRVLIAEDGTSAIDLVSDEVDVCLFDLMMPGATGFDCLRHVQAHHGEVPVIIISGRGEVMDAVSAMRDGAFDYFTKPCNIPTVLARVEDALAAHRQRAADSAAAKRVAETMTANDSQIVELIEGLDSLDASAG